MPFGWMPRSPIPTGAIVEIVAGCMVIMAGRHALQLDIVVASGGVAVAHGLLGLAGGRALHRRTTAVALLALLVLPRSEHITHYLGFPARLLAAETSAHLLRGLGLTTVSAETVLVLEGGMAHVDGPCSGLKTLWAGAAFYLVATFAYRRACRGRWLILGLGYGCALVAANVLRVTAVTAVAAGLGQSYLAELIHMPLGLTGFVVVSAAALHALPALVEEVPTDEQTPEAGTRSRNRLRTLALPLATVATVAALACLVLTITRATGAARPTARAASAKTSKLTLPSDLHAASIHLTDKERRFWSTTAAKVTKHAFQWQGTAGELLIIDTDDLGAHHPPQMCLAGAGHRIDHDRRWPISASLKARHTSVDDGRLTVLHWFQSASSTTDQMLVRAVQSAFGPRRWALVVILLRQPFLPGDPQLAHLAEQLHQSVAQLLREDPT